jgi:polyisoprenoid-binding protein YceI
MLRRSIPLHISWLCIALAVPAWAAPVPYVLDQRYATIGFSTSGLINTHGFFEKFSGRLILDTDAPQNSVVDVVLDDNAISMSWQPGVKMLESPAFFDAREFPQIIFHSTSITASGSGGQFDVLGELTIRGITKPQEMSATLVRAPAGSPDEETAAFSMTGTMQRSAFGMVSDRMMVGDGVVLNVHARISLAPAGQ